MLSPELLNKRKIGASDAPVIHGTAEKNWEINTPYKLWDCMVNNRSRKLTAAMQYGTEKEEPARQFFQKKLGKIYFGNQPVQHPEIEFMTATLDGIDPDKTSILEIKNPKKEIHELAKKGIISSVYYPQVQHQLEIVNKLYGIEKGYFGTCNGGDYAIVEFELDREFLSKLIQEEYEFWRCVQNKTAPKLGPWDYVEGDEKGVLIAAQMKELEETIKPLEEKYENLKKELVALSSHQYNRFGNFIFYSTEVKGSIDYGKIPELQSIDKEKYRKKSFNKWSLSIYRR